MQYHENSIHKHIQKFPKLKIAEPRLLATQSVSGSKIRLLAGFKFFTNPLKLLAVIITAIMPGHGTGIITSMPIAIVTTARNGVENTMPMATVYINRCVNIHAIL